MERNNSKYYRMVFVAFADTSACSPGTSKSTCYVNHYPVYKGI